MRLSEYLRPDLVLTLRLSGVEGVIHALASHLRDRGVVPSSEDVELGLLARERIHSTVLGKGLAVPHMTLAGLERATVMLALAPDPVQFGAPDEQPVGVFFVLLTPPGMESEHVKLLARICRLFREPTFGEDLRATRGPEEALALIARVERDQG